MLDCFRNATPCTFVASALVAGLLLSCASGPQTGVRTDFQQVELESVAVAPFYERGSFGLDTDRRQQLRDEYERAAVDALEASGFEVVDAQTLRHHLTERDAWRDFEDGVSLRSALTGYFEPGDDGTRRSIEIATIQDLADAGTLPVDALLFGEIVYHSRGTCRHRADDHNPYARVTTGPATPDELPRPCISSHFQAKLVDAGTGYTMWFNRTFIETHTDYVDRDVGLQTIARTVRATLTEDGGLTSLAPPLADDAHAESP